MTISNEYWWRNRTTLGGFDVGKRGNPSHCSVFAIDDDLVNLDERGQPREILIQLHQKFLDNWTYTRQVEYLENCVEYFNIQKLYYDASRAELDERGLPRQCIPVVLGLRTGTTAKGKMELAANFAKLVETNRIRLLDEDRFISQILCVSSDLQAPNTPMGHGDSFISVILAVGVYFDFFAKNRGRGMASLGNLQEIAIGEKIQPMNKKDNIMTTKFDVYKKQDICKICSGRVFLDLPDGRRKCQKCFTVWGHE